MLFRPSQPAVRGSNEELPKVDHFLGQQVHRERGAGGCSKHAITYLNYTALWQRLGRSPYATATFVAMRTQGNYGRKLLPRALLHKAVGFAEISRSLVRYAGNCRSKRPGSSGLLTQTIGYPTPLSVFDRRDSVVGSHMDRIGVLHAFEGDRSAPQRLRIASWGNLLSDQLELAPLRRAELISVRHERSGDCRRIAEGSRAISFGREIGICPDLSGRCTGASSHHKTEKSENIDSHVTTPRIVRCSLAASPFFGLVACHRHIPSTRAIRVPCCAAVGGIRA